MQAKGSFDKDGTDPWMPMRGGCLVAIIRVILAGHHGTVPNPYPSHALPFWQLCVAPRTRYTFRFSRFGWGLVRTQPVGRSTHLCQLYLGDLPRQAWSFDSSAVLSRENYKLG